MVTRSSLNVYRLMAFLVLAVVLAACGRDWFSPEGPVPLTRPLAAGSASTRPDGGQMLGSEYSEQLNDLSRLNLGRRLDFKSAPAEDLAALPGLGPAGVETAKERGYLLNYQRRNVGGLIMNESNFPLDKDDAPRTASDDL